MIILRRVNTGGATVSGSTTVIGDALSGDMNGSNQVYVTSYSYDTNSIMIDYNGQSLYSPDDFTESADKEITFIYIKPTADDILRANYEVAE